jgi:hypothetical protein
MAFNALINSIAPVPTPSDWVRPVDWITITDTPNEVQFLVADTAAKAFTIRTTFTRTTGNIYIDWGDGTTDTISTITSTDTSHVYSTGGTPCSRGYNTFKIRVYGDATCVITNAQQVSNFAVTGGSPYYTVGVLEAYFGDNTCNTTAFNSNYFNSNSGVASQPCFTLLEYVKLPSTVAWTTQMTYMFANCRSLYKVVMPTSASALTTFNNAFYICINLRDITFPSNATGITTLAATFDSCYNLRTVLFPTTLNSCTTLNTVFGSCSSLKNITLPSINLCTDFTNAFANCFSLQWFKFTSLPSPVSAGTTITCTSMFANNYNLQNVFYPSSGSTNAVHNMTTAFQNCYALRNIVFPTGFNANQFVSTFNANSSLTSVIFPASMANLVSMANCFSGCSLLNSVTLPTTVGASIVSNSAFLNCTSLPTIIIPSTWTINTLANTFQNCQSLTSITLPNNSQNTLTNMNTMCSGCSKLQTIVMPTSMTALTTLANTFQNCYRLTSVTFPATMNAVTTMSNAFNSCSTLTSVTLPTSMSTCTNWTLAFNFCLVLPSLTMPATVPVNANYDSMLLSCFNLKTVTLPTTQTTGLTTIQTMFSNCGSLTTITNLNKVGSLTATPLVNGTMVSGSVGTGTNTLTSLSFNCPFSILTLNGTTTTTNFNRLNSLRLLNASAGQWTGVSPQINISYCDLSTAALNTLFADIAAQGVVVSKTINITSCTGAAGLSAANRLVLTSIGWTITG